MRPGLCATLFTYMSFDRVGLVLYASYRVEIFNRCAMRIKIAIITTEFLRDFINASFRELKPGFSYSIHSYNAFEELSDIYRSVPESFSGVITTGSFPTQIINRSFPDTTRTIRTINNDDADICKLLLQLTISDKRLSLDRIYADPVDVFGVDLPEYVASERKVPFSERVDAWLGQQSLEYLIGMENFYRNRHLSLWREGRIDASITRFSSIMYPLRDAGLAVQFAYPSLSYMGQVCHETFQAVSLKHLRDNQAATIILNPAKTHDPGELASRQERLRRAAAKFCSLFPYEMMPRQTALGYELLTNRKAVTILSEDCTACRLQAELQASLGFGFSVGYGLGENIHHARMNALDANREASFFSEGASFLANERDEMIGPLRKKERLVVSRGVPPLVREASRSSGLSYLTVQKIAAAMAVAEDSVITARGLAELLSITNRSANRFLRALHETSLAEVIDMRRGTSRGRPERVYRIAVDRLGALSGDRFS